MRAWVILCLLCAAIAQGASYGKGSPDQIFLPAALCNSQTTVLPVTLWSLFATDPVATCPTGTAIRRGSLVFDDTNTCTSTSATVGCASDSITLPAEFPSAGRIDARLLFTSTDTTAAHTIVWTVATKCVTPTVGANASNGITSDPATMNAAQSLTYTVGASEVSASLRAVQVLGMTTTGCLGGDMLHVRVGRDITDTATTSLDFVGLELIIYGNP